jgi:hypothetical protein
MSNTYCDALIAKLYQSNSLFPFSEFRNITKNRLQFYKTLAHTLTDDELVVASKDAINAARMVANQLTIGIPSKRVTVSYNIVPKPLIEIKALLDEAIETGDTFKYFEAFCDMAYVKVILDNPQESYYGLGVLLHDIYGAHEEDGDLHKSDEDDPSEPQYIYTTTLRHIVKVELIDKDNQN